MTRAPLYRAEPNKVASSKNTNVYPSNSIHKECYLITEKAPQNKKSFSAQNHIFTIATHHIKAASHASRYGLDMEYGDGLLQL